LTPPRAHLLSTTITMANTIAGLSGSLDGLSLAAETVENVDFHDHTQQIAVGPKESESVQSNEKADQYVLLLIDASSHLICTLL
jgi:hypothetical protein